MPEHGDSPLIQSLPRPAQRDVVVIKIPPNKREITIAVEDGERVQVTYGNTTWEIDAETRRTLGWSTAYDERPTRPPSLWISRLGPDELAEINTEVHRLVYGDA